MATSGSVVKREVVAEEFEWKIKNFSFNGNWYCCPKVKFQSETWEFLVFPNPGDEYIHLYIIRSALGPPIAVKFYFALRTSDGHKSCERGGTEFFDQCKDAVTYRMISRTEFERRQPEFLSTGCLSLLIRMKSVHFVEHAGRRHFFRSKYIPVNSSAPVSRETLLVATMSDSVENENASREFEWKIENFSLSIHAHWSPEFTLQSETWKFGGIRKLSSGYIDLTVIRTSSGTPILVEFSFALQTSDGQNMFERVETEIFHEWKRSCQYRWMKARGFEARLSEFLSPGCLTVIVTVKIVESVEAASESGRKILQDFKQMFSSQENCDVVLRVKGQEFSAHKNVLMARSSVFAATFRNDMKERKSGFVDIDDIDPSVFSDFLCFLYCEEIENLSEENVCNLFTAADKYDIADLRSMCLNFMKQNLSVDRFCETLVLALLHNETDLVKICTDFFIQNAEEIIASVKWQLFVDENPTQSNEFLKYVKSMKHPKQ